MSKERKLAKQAGFTLPELVVVLAVLAILLSFAAPSLLQSWRCVVLDGAIQQVHRDLRWAQQIAVQEQKTVSLTFFQDQQPYRYVVRISGNPTYLRRRILPDRLTRMEAQTILVRADKSFQKNGHILLQKGEEQRYVYYYQTGRSRITRQAAT